MNRQMENDTGLTAHEDQRVVETVRCLAEKMFAGAKGSHDWEHSLRVYRLCQRIGPLENVDMTVLGIAAYLHDIGRCHQDFSNGEVCHARKGEEMAAPLVGELPIVDGQKKNILHCIRTHRFRGDSVPATKESKVLFDADKLDAIGAVGVARAYQFAGEVGARFHNPGEIIEGTRAYSIDDTGYREYCVKLRRIKERILTQTGRGLAEERHTFMELFFNRFLREHRGEC
jgi:uncharacterized protein